jgi:hypothetical protein
MESREVVWIPKLSSMLIDVEWVPCHDAMPWRVLVSSLLLGHSSLSFTSSQCNNWWDYMGVHVVVTAAKTICLSSIQKLINHWHYNLTQSESSRSDFTFTMWCGILFIIRTNFWLTKHEKEWLYYDVCVEDFCRSLSVE